VDATRQRYLKVYWERQLGLIDEMLAPYRRPDGVLLDVGCGIGRNARRFAAGFGRYLGLNLDADELLVAREKNPDSNFDFLRGDAMDMAPISASSADAALLIFVLEHIADPPRLFAELARVLKPGGGVLFIAPNLWNLNSLVIRALPTDARLSIKRVLTGKDEPPDYPIYYRCNTVARMDQVAAAHGFARDRLEMLSSLGYLFRLPGFYAWHRFTDRLMELGGLKRFREFIFVTYRKIDTGKVHTTRGGAP
jgi:SAM-dependent methyltransferase